MTQETVILDIGTGDGNVIRLFPGSQKMQIIGMDASKSMLMEAKRKFPGNGYILGVPVQDDTIDVITCIGLSEYVAELTSLLKEIRRVVKPGGRILFTISPKSVFTYLRSLAGVKVHARAPAQVKSLLAEHGFEIQGKSHTLMQVQYLLSIN